ncbi:hypothetical protein FI667_g876, partial [Globisporangium splendens]
MATYYDELLDENDEIVNEFLDEHFFGSDFFATDMDPNAVPPPWATATLPAPSGMRNYVNIVDTTMLRSSTHTTCHLVVSTLNEAIKAITADVTNLYKCMETELIGSDLLADAQVLEIVKPRTKENPHDCVLLKHVKYRSVLEEYQAEDFLLLETTGKGVHPHNGVSYAFKTVRSIDVPGADELLEHKDVRLECHRGVIHNLTVIFSETKCPDILRMDLWLDVNVTHTREQFCGGFSGLHDAFSLSIRYRHLVENYISTTSGTSTSMRRSSSTTISSTAIAHFSANQLAVAQGRERVCQMCTKKVSFFGRIRKQICSVCGIFLCSPCVTSTEFNSWKLCGLCFDRNETLIGRHTISRLAASSFAKITYMAKVKMGFDRHRQSLYGGDRATMLNRRATVASTRKNSDGNRLSFIQKTSGRSAYAAIAEGSGDAADAGGRGSFFDGTGRPAAMSLPRTESGSGYGRHHSTSGVGISRDRRRSSGVLFDGKQQKTPTAASTANDYYLSNMNKSYTLSKSRIQLLNDDQQSRLSARTTWRSSNQSDFADIHSIPETESSGASARSRAW